MPVTRRYYSNLTKPKRCVALVPSEDGSLAIKCVDRVSKSGLCGKHYTDREKYREHQRKTVTRHKLGIDDSGKVVYGTMEQGVEVNFCNTSNCRRRPIINLENILYCEKCFNREQRRRVSHETLSNPNRPEASNVNERGINRVI